jgi:hypothetical protein
LDCLKKIGFLSFRHWAPSPQSRTQSATETLLQSIDFAVEAERSLAHLSPAQITVVEYDPSNPVLSAYNALENVDHFHIVLRQAVADKNRALHSRSTRSASYQNLREAQVPIILQMRRCDEERAQLLVVPFRDLLLGLFPINSRIFSKAPRRRRT